MDKLKREFRYDAFISYRHLPLDRAIAIRLQQFLERFKPPSGIRFKNSSKIKRVFRDESELPTSGDLSSDIRRALESSRFLIVICSKETKHSKWCLEEIEYFKALHNGQTDKILTLLVSGDPHEVFPDALCSEKRAFIDIDGTSRTETVTVEPLAANVCAPSTSESLKLLKTEFLRIAAPILGCNFDDLFRRHQRRLVRNIINGAAAVVALLGAFAIYAGVNNAKLNSQIRETQNQMLFRTIEYADELSESGDRVQAAAIISEAYERFDKSSPYYEEFRSSVEHAIFNTVYYDAYLPYTKLEATGNRSFFEFSPDSRQLVIAGNYETSTWSEGNLVDTYIVGKITVSDVEGLNELLQASVDAAVGAICHTGKYIAIGTVDASLVLIDPLDGKIHETIKNTSSTEADSKAALGITDIAYNEKINSLVYVNTVSAEKSELCIYPLDKPKAQPAFCSSFEAQLSLSQNGRYATAYNEAAKDSSAELYNLEKFCLDLNSFDIQLDESANLRAMSKNINLSEKQLESITKFAIADDGSLYLINIENNSRRFENLDILVYDIEAGKIKHNSTGLRNLSSESDWYIYSLQLTVPNEYNGKLLIFNGQYFLFVSLEADRAAVFADSSEVDKDTSLVNAYSFKRDISLSADDSLVLLECSYHTGYSKHALYDIDGRLLNVFIVDNDTNNIELSPDGRYTLLSAYNSLSLYKNEASSLEALKIQAPTAQSFSYQALTDGGITVKFPREIATAKSDAACFYDFINEKELAKLEISQPDYMIYFDNAVFSDDGAKFAGVEGDISPAVKQCFLRIWDVESGEILYTLDAINEILKKYDGDLPDRWFFSDDGEHLMVVIDSTTYIYRIKDDTILYTDLFGGNGAAAFDFKNDSVIRFNQHEGRINQVDYIRGNKTELVHADFGIDMLNKFHRATAFANSDRLIIETYSTTNHSSYNSKLYSLSTGALLCDLGEITGFDTAGYTFEFTNDCRYAISYAMSIVPTDKPLYLWKIPTFAELLEMTDELGKNRTLTESERQKSGLIVFDS